MKFWEILCFLLHRYFLRRVITATILFGACQNGDKVQTTKPTKEYKWTPIFFRINTTYKGPDIPTAMEYTEANVENLGFGKLPSVSYRNNAMPFNLTDRW